jgi:hypothetical protein
MTWEYHLEVLDLDGKQQLSRLGRDGWELVAVVDKVQLLAYFKRPPAPPKEVRVRGSARISRKGRTSKKRRT